MTKTNIPVSRWNLSQPKLQVRPQSAKSREEHPRGATYFQKDKSNPQVRRCPCLLLKSQTKEKMSNSAQQPRGPSSKLLRKVCATAGAGEDGARWREKYWKATSLGGNLRDKFSHLFGHYRRRKERCDRGFRSLCPFTEINRHRLPERRLLEVNTLNILIIFIPHFLTAKSWLALPSYAVVSSRWDAYVRTPYHVFWAGPDAARR